MKRQHGPWSSQHADLRRRLDATERRLDQLRNALNALARETNGIQVTHPCRECGECLLFVREGVLYCPRCGYSRPQ